MIVDDRLQTVLRNAAGTGAGASTHFRQLADLLGRTPTANWTAQHGAGLARLDQLHQALGDEVGAALLRSCALRSPLLVDHFARKGPRTALAAIAGARLAEAEWLALIPTLPVQARGFLRHRRDLGPAVERLLTRLGVDDFALPEPDGYVPVAVPVVAPISVAAAPAPVAPLAIPLPADALVQEVAAQSQKEGIGAIVRRIEAFRRTRESVVATPAPASEHGQTRLPFGDEARADGLPDVAAIDIRIDAEGMIVSASGGFGPMLVGHRPFTADADAPAFCDAATARAAHGHLPVERGLVTLEGAEAIAGPWRIDAAPIFGHPGGSFLGYGARLRRPPVEPLSSAGTPPDDASADRLRQILHELRTPINAIQGFAELIQQQLFGPTPHQYRSLAASIASDAARMLAGFEEVERLVGLETGRLTCEAGASDPGALLQRLVAQVEPAVRGREVKLRCSVPVHPVAVGVAPAELERTLWRIVSVVSAAAAPGERLSFTLAERAGYARLTVPLPSALAMRDDAALFAPDTARTGAAPGAAMLGNGFTLRLASAEVRAAGGNIGRNGARLWVDLPLLTAAQPLNSAVAE
ncbi:sensor histidine kinase KdpD [Novosphingobium sp. FKTRR1]|uniref:sensor histidine kinase n=1 Tax=Novosphingobium sp. FKTRR1 TaxID=2879118 RepID=UPI001CEFBD47|nr:histidine kinase dimerization/phospho-acceptor domain-containing protein [Novosphingobium sp. FKTRR1]